LVEHGVRREALKGRARNAVVSPRVQVSEMQRSRLLAAAVVSVEELGWAHVTVASIASRARVSRRTFYDLFSDRDDCLLAVCEATTGRIAAEIAVALGARDGLSWRERLRGGLWVVLSFFDREPELARFCVVQSASGGQRALGWREALLARLTTVVQEGAPRRDGRVAQVPSLTAEGLVGAVLTIVHRRLSSAEREPLGDLLGALMALIVLPYSGPGAARSESTRPVPTPARKPSASSLVEMGGYRAGQDPLADVPMRLTYRTARVLQAAAECPGGSNRRIGERADIYDPGQISKLLTRLERIGLLQNTGIGHAKGEPNAWHLTPLGERVVEHLNLDRDPAKDAA
jgi:AcrR family transcriptional regulator/DNA-binding MarR family transcriptional regulator